MIREKQFQPIKSSNGLPNTPLSCDSGRTRWSQDDLYLHRIKTPPSLNGKNSPPSVKVDLIPFLKESMSTMAQAKEYMQNAEKYYKNAFDLHTIMNSKRDTQCYIVTCPKCLNKHKIQV